jgi:hypothetical protein
MVGPVDGSGSPDRQGREYVVQSTLDHARAESYRGYDPYDCMNSPVASRLPGRYLRIAATQFVVYSPVNVRPLIGIRKDVNPKGLALFLLAYLDMERTPPREGETLPDEAERILGMLMERANTSYSGPCWGYHFPWQDLAKFIPRGEPSVVVTSFAAKAISTISERYGRRDLLPVLEGIGRFIENDLNRFEDDDGICLSYSPHDRNIVHNANLLGAVALQRVMVSTGMDRYRDLVGDCFRFTLKKQHQDGSWAYSPVSYTHLTLPTTPYV